MESRLYLYCHYVPWLTARRLRRYKNRLSLTNTLQHGVRAANK